MSGREPVPAEGRGGCADRAQVLTAAPRPPPRPAPGRGLRLHQAPPISTARAEVQARPLPRMEQGPSRQVLSGAEGAFRAVCELGLWAQRAHTGNSIRPLRPGVGGGMPGPSPRPSGTEPGASLRVPPAVGGTQPTAHYVPHAERCSTEPGVVHTWTPPGLSATARPSLPGQSRRRPQPPESRSTRAPAAAAGGSMGRGPPTWSRS